MYRFVSLVNALFDYKAIGYRVELFSFYSNKLLQCCCHLPNKFENIDRPLRDRDSVNTRFLAWADPSPHPKRHFDRFHRFCRVHGCVQQTHCTLLPCLDGGPDSLGKGQYFWRAFPAEYKVYLACG